MIYTTEIASNSIISDAPIHYRLLSAYCFAQEYIKGNLLELGCGEGRGVKLLSKYSESYLGIDKIQKVIDTLNEKYPNNKFIQSNIPPFKGIEDNSFDTVITFQVIEHIKDDNLFLKEIYRVLKPGGKCIITTPNIDKTLSRNPWHIREYKPKELGDLCKKYFSKVEVKGISGDEIIWKYYEENKKSVNKIMKWDILNLQYRLPSWMLRMPYEILNRMNRKKLNNNNNEIVTKISEKNFNIVNDANDGIDLFVILKK